VGVAARRPFPLVVLAVTVAMTLTVHWVLLPLGVVAYVAMVFSAAGDVELPVRRPEMELAPITSPAFRAQLQRIDRTQREISHSVDLAYGSLRELLRPIASGSEELYGQANALAAKGQTIEQYLGTTDPGQLQRETNALDRRIAATEDPYTLDQLHETRQALVDRQQNAETLVTHHDRITAQLQNIDTSLQNVLAETVRLRTADTATATAPSDEAAKRLRDLNARMDAYQEVLEGALTQSGATATS
jgi:chromosome segregation ATPase